MTKHPPIQFIDNPAITGRADAYVTITLNVGKALKSWQKSLFSYEWLNKDGTVKSLQELPDKEKPKRQEVEMFIANNQPLVRPVLGIGLLENIEIGIGRAEFLTAASYGMPTIQVHVLRSNETDFKKFLA